MLNLRSSLLYPARPPKLNLGHPAFAGGKGRLAAVSIGDSTMRDLLSGSLNLLPSQTIAGELTPGMGPTVHPTGAAPSTGVEFAAQNTSETLNSYGMACIFSPRAMTIGQGFVNTNGASGSNHKIATTSVGTLQFSEVSAALTFLNPVQGHIYFVACVATSVTPTSGQMKSQGVCIDLTTGQVDVQQSTSFNAATTPGNYSVGTYTSVGGADQGRVACAAIFAKWLSMRELLDWAQNDPWGLWYDSSSKPLNFLSVANNAPVAGVNNVSFAVNDAKETFSGSLTNITPGSNNLVLVANDAVEIFNGRLKNIAPPSGIDMHDGDNYVPAYLADRWKKAKDKYGKEQPVEDRQPVTKPKAQKKTTVKIRRLKAKPQPNAVNPATVAKLSTTLQ